MAEHRLRVNRREGRVRLLVNGRFEGFLGGKAELTPRLLESLLTSYTRRAREEGHSVVVEDETETESAA